MCKEDVVNDLKTTFFEKDWYTLIEHSVSNILNSYRI